MKKLIYNSKSEGFFVYPYMFDFIDALYKCVIVENSNGNLPFVRTWEYKIHDVIIKANYDGQSMRLEVDGGPTGVSNFEKIILNEAARHRHLTLDGQIDKQVRKIKNRLRSRKTN